MDIFVVIEALGIDNNGNDELIGWTCKKIINDKNILQGKYQDEVFNSTFNLDLFLN